MSPISPDASLTDGFPLLGKITQLCSFGPQGGCTTSIGERAFWLRGEMDRQRERREKTRTTEGEQLLESFTKRLETPKRR